MRGLETIGQESNPWIVTASREIREIQRRWGVGSYRQLSDLIHINRRTLAKLNPKHPDGSLELATLDRIYATFLYLYPFYFAKEEQEEERRLLVESRIRILMCMEVHREVLRGW